MKTLTHLNETPFYIDHIDGFQIVRDDLYTGGTKKRAFEKYIDNIQENEFVYGCDYKGHASYAIALTALERNKKVTLFFNGPLQDTVMFRKVSSLPNVTYRESKEPIPLRVAEDNARKYAIQAGAKFLPLGLDFEGFRDALTEVVRSAKIVAPEIWVLGGTGNLARALQNAYPNTPVCVVNLKSVYGDFGNPAIVYDAPESFPEDAEILPPYPSVSNYDAKLWRFIKKYAKPNACVWNVSA